MTKSRFLTAITLNSLIVAGEVFLGFMANSIALLTDAFHNFGDVLSLAIALIAFIYSGKKATREMTYGYLRSEMLAGFVHSLFLLLSMAVIIYGAAGRLFRTVQVNSGYMIITAMAAFSVNLFSALLFRVNGHDHGKEGHEAHENMNISASYLHLISDAGLSLGVAAGGVLIMIFHIPFIDPAIAILFSLFVAGGSLRILKRTFLSLMDAAPANTEDIVCKILTHKAVKSVHDIHIIKPSSKDMYFSAHLVLDRSFRLETIESLFEELRCDLADFGITHAIFQPETEKYHASDNLCQSHS